MKNLFKVLFLSFALAMTITACSDDDNNGGNGGNGGIAPKFEGAYILNEGNMSSETGSLHFLDAQNHLYENVFATANSGKHLGNVAQDMYIHNNKIYVVAQNGTRDTFCHLTVFDKDTYKLVGEYYKDPNAGKDKYSPADWVTHIAVLDEEHVYLRVNGKGIFCLNTKTGEKTPVKGSESAQQRTMVVLDGKVIAMGNKKTGFLVIEKDKEAVAHPEIADIQGIAKTYDGNLWMVAPTTIYKVSGKDFSIIDQHEITDFNVNKGYGNASVIGSAKGNIYYADDRAGVVWKHNFAQNTTTSLSFKEFMPTPYKLYNGFAVNPVNGDIYLAQLKDYGNDYLTNSVIRLKDNGSKLELVWESDNNPLRFCAGIFFPEQFE